MEALIVLMERFMNGKVLKNFGAAIFVVAVVVASIGVSARIVRAQETGGDLGGGAGIFRAKNPETKRGSNPSRPGPRPTRPSGPSAADIEARFEDALDAGNDARDAHKFVQAETSYRAAIKLKPRDWRGLYGLGNIFSDQQRWEDAEKAYRQAVDYSASSVDALVALSFVLVQPRTGAANARLFADSENFARRATVLQPNSAIAFDRLGVAMMARGIMNKDTESAFRRAVELDPNFLVAQIHLARVLRHLGRFSEADPIYNSAVAKASDAPTLVLIADAMQAEQSWDNSESVLKRALEIDGRNPGALFLLGRLLVVRKLFGDAEPVLKRAIEINPKGFQSYNLLGRSYLGLDRYDDAYRTYERAADLASPADRKQLAGAFGFTGVADGFMNAGKYREAARAYDRALQLDPGNAELQTKAAAARAKIR
jgi:tetratricopeptide (TPR) repeat protein